MFNSSPNPSCSLLEWQLIANRSSEFGHVQLVPKYKSKVKLPREQSPNILSEMIKSQENGISLLVIFVDRQKECSASFPKIVTRSSHSRSCYQRVILPPPLTNTLSQFRSKLNMIWKAKSIFVAWQKCRIPFNVKPSLHWSWQLSAARQWEFWGSIQCSNAECIGLLCWVDFSPLCIFKCVLKCCASQRVQ